MTLVFFTFCKSLKDFSVSFSFSRMICSLADIWDSSLSRACISCSSLENTQREDRLLYLLAREHLPPIGWFPGGLRFTWRCGTWPGFTLQPVATSATEQTSVKGRQPRVAATQSLPPLSNMLWCLPFNSSLLRILNLEVDIFHSVASQVAQL